MTIFRKFVTLVASMLASTVAFAQLGEQDAASGIRAALERGSQAAVGKLSAAGGFLDNPTVKIPLPESLRTVRKGAKILGMDKQFSELEVSINRAAEAAVPEAKALLVGAVKQLSVKDALGIVRGGDDSVTQYFRKMTGTQISDKFLPIIAKMTDKAGVKQRYDGIAAQAGKLGLIKSNQASLDKYVTTKAVDGLFIMIAQEERAIRQDPIGTGSALLRKVFSSR
jgi:Protein of unknown function (DUF4197)